MSQVHLIDHPLVQHKLTLMRRKEASTNSFRRMLGELSTLMAYEITRDMPLQDIEIDTPMETMTGKVIDGKKLVLVSILRAGNGFLDGMLNVVRRRANRANASVLARISSVTRCSVMTTALDSCTSGSARYTAPANTPATGDSKRRAAAADRRHRQQANHQQQQHRQGRRHHRRHRQAGRFGRQRAGRPPSSSTRSAPSTRNAQRRRCTAVTTRPTRH